MNEDERRGMHALRRALLTIVVLLATATVGVAWYFADQLTLPPTVRPFEPDNAVVAVAGDTLTLADEGFAAIDGRWGLQLPEQRHVVLVEQLGRTPDGVRWRFRDTVGGADPVAGEPVRVDEFVSVGDPADVGLAFEDVTVDGPLGALPSWWVPASGDPGGTVVFVHGRGATREEALRFLPLLVDEGWNVLVHSYRGDEGAPGLPDDRLRYGTAEWPDVAAAVTHAADRAEGPVVLFGTSMGGALVTQYLDNAGDTPAHDRVAGVVLDSPLLSMDALLDLQADLNGIPELAEPALLPLVQLFADHRVDLESARLEQVEDDATFDRPLLLVHGDADTFVPPEPSQRLAELLDDVVFLREPDAGHVRTWNVARDRYAAALRSFLAEVAS